VSGVAPSESAQGLELKHQKPFEVFGDEQGLVAIGWVGDGVLYARFVGGLSSSVGAAFARQLQGFISQTPSLQYFADASALTHYDLLARSAFVRVVMAHRRQFTAITILTWAEGVSSASNAFAAVIGDAVSVLVDSKEFESRLLRAAPLAKQKIDPKKWSRSLRPARSSR
jgi:hypothetical protein